MDASRRCLRGLAALGLVATLSGSDGALAQGDSCHQWADEHRDWTVRVVRLYLTGGGRHELDTALFELVQREDDNEETISSRLAVYREQTEPVVGYYEKRGKLKTVDADGSIDEVYGRLVEALT